MALKFLSFVAITLCLIVLVTSNNPENDTAPNEKNSNDSGDNGNGRSPTNVVDDHQLNPTGRQTLENEPLPLGPGPSTGLGENVKNGSAGANIGWAAEEGPSKRQNLGNPAEVGPSASPRSTERLVLAEPPKSGTSELQCPVCGKIFGSRKAVYGHLRSHPERTWRGMSDAPVQPFQPSSATIDCGQELLETQLAPTLLNIAQQTLRSISGQAAGGRLVRQGFHANASASVSGSCGLLLKEGCNASTIASTSGGHRNIDLNAEPQNSGSSPPAVPAPPVPHPQAPQGGGRGGAAAFDLNMPAPDDGGNGNGEGNDRNGDNAAAGE